MSHSTIAALCTKLLPYTDLGKARTETLCHLLLAVISSRTVNLSHVAADMVSSARISSSYRRLQRFFQYVTLLSDWSAPLIVALLGLKHRRRDLCLDRTCWKVGSKDINVLVLALSTRRYRVPLLWTLLSGPGNSRTDERIGLLKRYLALFDASTIRLVLADREFIGERWMNFLHQNTIPFAIRLRETMHVELETSPFAGLESGRVIELRTLLRRCTGRRRFRAWIAGCQTCLTIEARRLSEGDLLIVATNARIPNLLKTYRRRWAIEAMFADAKTRGLNLEDTRIVCPRKLSSLLVIVALALAWAHATASKTTGRANLARKAHGFYAKSWFRTGFDLIRRTLRTEPINAIDVWLALPVKRSTLWNNDKNRVV